METEAITLDCTRCGLVLPLDGFYPVHKKGRQAGPRHGRHGWCKDCKKAYNRERMAARSPEQVEADRLWFSEYNRKRNLSLKYGLSLEDYDRMLAEQGGVCAICGQPERRKVRVRNREEVSEVLAVDHDHVTSQVRGLLCHACNLSLGGFEDDPARLRRAADYLERAQS